MTQPNPLQPESAPVSQPSATVDAPTPAASTLGEPAAAPAADPAALAADRPPLSEADKDAVIRKLRDENGNWRTRIRELEPKAKAFDEAAEAQKTEVQRATDRATAAEQALATREQELNILRAAAKHGIPEEDHDLLGSGTPEELDARAARLAARYPASAPTPPPPSDRPVEGLRPGASPTPPAPADTSYPAAWAPRGRQS